MEPVWGGQEDSAPALRAQSALALSGCPGITYDQAINELVRLLVDPAWNVRVAATQAIANLGYPQGAPLLRLRALLGDAEPRVIGACLEGLLHLSQIEAVPFIQEFFNHPDMAIRLEAHCVLATSSLPEAVGLAIAELETLTNPRARKAVMAALASSSSPSALDFLLGLLSSGSRSKALAALEVLHPRLQQREFYERTLAAITQNPDSSLRALLESHL
jgi:HEAT repeat protein